MLIFKSHSQNFRTLNLKDKHLVDYTFVNAGILPLIILSLLFQHKSASLNDYKQRLKEYIYIYIYIYIYKY